MIKSLTKKLHLEGVEISALAVYHPQAVIKSVLSG